MPFARTIRASKNRVAYPFAHFAKGWGIARSASALLLLAATSLLHAQSASCGITSITESSKLAYPPIARAAHVGGTVILLARFDHGGTPAIVEVVSGPMLRAAATEFVKGWRVDKSEGSRECPIVIAFNIIEGDKPVCSYKEAGPPQLTRSDLQHVSVSVRSIWTCDPQETITTTKARKRWF